MISVATQLIQLQHQRKGLIVLTRTLLVGKPETLVHQAQVEAGSLRFLDCLGPIQHVIHD